MGHWPTHVRKKSAAILIGRENSFGQLLFPLTVAIRSLSRVRWPAVRLCLTTQTEIILAESGSNCFSYTRSPQNPRRRRAVAAPIPIGPTLNQIGQIFVNAK